MPPKSLDDCVSGVRGKSNKRTGKPFTESEAFAVCTARLQAAGVLKKGTQKSKK